MAVTGYWPVYGNLKTTLDYANNPDKTTPREYLDEDLYDTLKYVGNDNKTDKQLFVGGINCSKQNAYAEMIAVQRRFGMKGKVVAYHGIQSFKTGEVTPEQAFEIGKETARRMWGNKYQVLVTVHLNTDNLHCHFVVNPCSFIDGQKFKNKIGDHLELRKVSDAVCREHNISVLQNSEFYTSGKKKEYWAHKSGQMTHRDMLKRDIEYCLKYSSDEEKLEKQLYGLGYTIDWQRMSVKGKYWERAVRLRNIGFTDDVIYSYFARNKNNFYFYDLEWNTHPPYKPKRFPLLWEAKRLEFKIEHSHDTATVAVDLVFLLLIRVFELLSEITDTILLSAELRHEVRNIKQFISDYKFMQSENLHTIKDIKEYIGKTESNISELEHQRQLIDNKRRRATPDTKQQYKTKRQKITEHITPLRKKLKQAKDILDKSPRLFELIRQEFDIEFKSQERIKNKER